MVWAIEAMRSNSPSITKLSNPIIPSRSTEILACCVAPKAHKQTTHQIPTRSEELHIYTIYTSSGGQKSVNTKKASGSKLPTLQVAQDLLETIQFATNFAEINPSTIDESKLRNLL